MRGKRIALCLSGQPRTWRHTHDSMFRYFSTHDLDVFFHTWDEIEQSELDDILRTYAPASYVVESRPSFISEKQKLAELFPVSPPFTIFDMAHSTTASLVLALEAHDERAPYDLICRSRFDIIYDGLWSDAPPPKGSIAIQSAQHELEVGFNDQFAIGDVEAMRDYAGFAAWLPDGMRDLQGPAFRPEVALQHYLQAVCPRPVERERLSFALLREEQVGRRFTDLRDDPMFHARKREDWEAFATAHLASEVTGRLNFEHFGRTPLMLDRWLEALPADQRSSVLSLDWPLRMLAIDRLIAAEVGPPPMAQADYGLVRLICAALVHRMRRDEPMTVEGFIVHALSANFLDMRRAQQWIQEDMKRSVQVAETLRNAPTLGAALRFAPPFEQPPAMGWRVE